MMGLAFVVDIVGMNIKNVVARRQETDHGHAQKEDGLLGTLVDIVVAFSFHDGDGYIISFCRQQRFKWY